MANAKNEANMTEPNGCVHLRLLAARRMTGVVPGARLYAHDGITRTLQTLLPAVDCRFSPFSSSNGRSSGAIAAPPLDHFLVEFIIEMQAFEDKFHG